ncbi:MAG: hypothetical protein ABIE43_01090, partial [Patescibacteria group bacterium]
MSRNKLKDFCELNSNFIIGAVILIASFFIISASAAPPASPYLPGETLNPTCSPGDPYCTVGLTTGSIIFANSSGYYSQDNTNLFWDDTNNRLGLGTTSPSVLLTIGSTTPTHVSGYRDGFIAGAWEIDGQLYVDGTGNNYFGGNIGLGTTSPIASLAVAGTSYFTDISTSTAKAVFTYSPQSAGAGNALDTSLYINAASPAPDANLFTVANTNTWKLRVDAEGDIFIQGNLTTAGTVSQATTEVTGNLTVEGWSILGDAPNNDYHNIKGYTKMFATSTEPALSIYQSSTGNLLSVFNTDTEHFTIANNGNVGIGTTSPNRQVQILGAGQLTANLTDAGNGGGTINISQNVGSSGSGGALLFSALNDSGTYLPQAAIKSLMSNGANNGIGHLAFSTRNSIEDAALTERMRITNTGNVGIGTTSPGAKLHIVRQDQEGDLTLERVDTTIGDANNIGIINFRGGIASPQTVAQIRAMSTQDWTETAFGTALAFYTTANDGSTNSEKMRIDNSGNVGIGTTGPQTKLDVAVDGLVGIRVSDSGDSGNARVVLADSSGNGGYLGLYNDSEVLTTLIRGYAVNGTQAYFNSGNVGIGTTTPNSKLSINGVAGTQLELIQNDTLTSWRPNVQSDDFYITETGVGNPFVIQQGGNVGIGTTSPTAQLELLETSGDDPGRGVIFHQQRNDAASFMLSLIKSRPTTLTALDNDYISVINGKFYNDAATPELVTGTKIVSQVIDASDGTEDADLYFKQIVAGADTEVMRLKAGNVGIGTTEPDQKLEVVSSIDYRQLRLTDTKTDSTIQRVSLTAQHYTVAEEPLGLIGAYVGSATNEIFIGGGMSANNAATHIRFNTAADTTTVTGTERMRIDSNGNVGIGTTSPLTKLSIEGTAGQPVMN